MINADDFIMHSSFNYNAPVIMGYKDFSNVALSGPTVFELVSGVQSGDRFRVVQEDSAGTNVYSMGGPFPTFTYYAQGGKLYAMVRAQSVGQTFTGRFHYRIYRESNQFVFSSKTAIENVIYSNTGIFTGGFGANIKLTNTTGKKMMLYGVWRVVGTNNWYSDGYSGNSSSGTLGLNHTTSQITLAWGAGNSSSTQIEYRIIGTELYDVNSQDLLLFTDTLPVSATFNTTISHTTGGTSLAAGATRTTYSAWVDTMPGSLGVNAYIDIGGKVYPDFAQEHPLNASPTGPRLNVWVEKDADNKVRVAFKEMNTDSVTHTYASLTASVKLYMMNIR